MQESAEGARARYERLAQFFAQHPQSFPTHLEFVLSRIAPELPPAEACEPCEGETSNGSTADAASGADAAAVKAEGVQEANVEVGGQEGRGVLVEIQQTRCDAVATAGPRTTAARGEGSTSLKT